MQRHIKNPVKHLRQISAKTAKDIQSLTVFAKNSIPEVWPGF